jgi:hypothetical protein
MSRATALFRLQGVDSELDACRARLKDIDQVLSDSPEVREVHQRLIEAQAQLHTARVALQSLELDNQAFSEKIAEADERLYSGRVTNPKELRDLEQDIASLKRQRAAVEERQLEALIRAETAEADVGAVQARQQQVEQETARLHSSLLEERNTLTARLERLEIEREAILAPLPADDREMYERLRRTKNGRAVVQLEEGVCTACGVAPSSSRIQSVRQGNELVRCGNCDRILYSE